jgi:hypothetical protein
MKMKRAKKSRMPITPEVIPMTPQAFHAGIKVIRYFSDPISRKRIADPVNEITMANKTVTIKPEIRSLWRRFLNSASASCAYSLRTAFISLSNA